MENNDLKYKDLAKSLFVLFIKQIRKMVDFTDKLNELDSIFDITIELNEEILPINKMFEIFGLVDNKERNIMSDKIYYIAYDENIETIEDTLENFLKEYGF